MLSLAAQRRAAGVGLIDVNGWELPFDAVRPASAARGACFSARRLVGQQSNPNSRETGSGALDRV